MQIFINKTTTSCSSPAALESGRAGRPTYPSSTCPQVKQISQAAKETSLRECEEGKDTSRLPHTILQTRNSRYPLPCAACPLPPAPLATGSYHRTTTQTESCVPFISQLFVCVSFGECRTKQCVCFGLSVRYPPRPLSSHPRCPVFL